MTQKEEVILIFHIASLGDTVISIPCYREIARRHSNARRYMLTNFPIGGKMVPAESLLLPMGLIAGSIEYPMPLRRVGDILRLHRKLAALQADTLYYLTPEKKVRNMVRHCAFFRTCGIANFHGVPWSKDIRYPRETVAGRMWETEGSRLLRAIGGKAGTEAPEHAERDLMLSDSEKQSAKSALERAIGPNPFIAVSVGGKVPINNWGDHNWSNLLAMLTRKHPSLGIVFVGSTDERERNDNLARSWMGPLLNSCGLFTPRQTAALLSYSALFLGHDTGTLHLAAAVGTRIVGIYSARNVPGKWFSGFQDDIFFYHQPPCFGCELVQVAECSRQRTCVTALDPAAISDAVSAALQRAGIGATQTVTLAYQVPDNLPCNSV